MNVHLPSYYLDPLVFGDIRAGSETVQEIADDSRLYLGIPWLAGLVVSQGRPGMTAEIKGMILDGQETGDWHFSIDISGNVMRPDPAIKKRLKADGQETLDVLNAVNDSFGMAVSDKIRHLSFSLIAQSMVEGGGASWVFKTTLGRIVTVNVNRTNTN